MDTKTQNGSQPPEIKSWREERLEHRQARRAALGGPSRAGALVAGFLLVIFGAIFLLQNYFSYTIPLKNWGALFILIPAIVAFDRSYRIYRTAGNRFTAAALGAAVVGLILLAVTVVILFNLNWAIWGPVLAIVAGLGLLLGVFFKNGKQ
jgi:O-antigen/teichoic acid export membrane protein